MPTVKFSKDWRFSWRKGQSEYDFEGGKTYRGVKRDAAEAAVKAGAGEIVGEEQDEGGESPTIQEEPA